jgi:hypothetical protein
LQVALDNGRVLFAGPQTSFIGSSVMQGISHSTDADTNQPPAKETIIEEAANEVHKYSSSDNASGHESDSATLAKSTSAEQTSPKIDGSASVVPADSTTVKKAPRKLIEDEARAVGRVKMEIVRLIKLNLPIVLTLAILQWQIYLKSCGSFVS